MSDVSEILFEMKRHGLDPGSLNCDGKPHRFKADQTDKKKSGWYIVYQNVLPLNNDVFYVAVFGDYRMSTKYQFQTLNQEDLTPEDKKLIKKQMDAAKKKAEEDRINLQKEVATQVQADWNNLSNEGHNLYLDNKKIQPEGIKFDNFGNIYVPMIDADGKLWSLQKIQPDGGKFFFPAGRVEGCFHVLGDLKTAKKIFLCEGYSTGSSIRMATGAVTVIAFNSNNLVKCAKSIREKFKELEIVICGDDDRWHDDPKKINAGRVKAQEAAKLSLATVVFPDFSILHNKPTDFNDLHLNEGIDAVKKQLVKIESAPKLAVYALGHKGKEYFFTTTKNRQIMSVSSFTETDLLKLVPRPYWEAMFPNGKDGIDWTQAKSDMIDKCHQKGLFQPKRVRGSGVWMDAGRVVVNMGNHLIVDGKKTNLGGIKSKYFYTLGNSLEELHENPLSIEECETLYTAAQNFKWIRQESGLLLAGALVATRVCGALPIRPHVWITGSAQTGKTTMLQRLIHPILGESKVYVQGGTSEAGLRQSLEADAVPVLFDEFETNGKRSRENIDACIELMRAAWAESNAMIVKGGATGNASFYQVRFSAIVSSIRTRLDNDADKGRFAVLELAPHGSDQSHWEALNEQLLKIDQEYGERLFARAIKMLPTMIHNWKLIKKEFAKRVNSRFGDQYGMILAGYSILVWDDPITEADAKTIVDEVNLKEEKEETADADHDDALNHLLTTKTRVASGEDYLISDLIRQEHDRLNKNTTAFGMGIDIQAQKALKNLGIKVTLDSVFIVQANHAELEKQVWAPTKWSKNWGNSLSRLDGTLKSQSEWIAGKTRRCLKLPLNLIIESQEK